MSIFPLVPLLPAESFLGATMLFYFGKHITSSATGQRLKNVICDKCETSYSYFLARSASGAAEAPYNLGESSAAERARVRAGRNLGKRLEGDAELVPCPECGWVNENLVKAYRKRKYRFSAGMFMSIVAFGLLAGFFFFVSLEERLGAHSRVPGIAGLAPVVISILSPIWAFLVSSLLRRRIDPNRMYPGRPAVPPGTPPARIQRTNPLTGEVHIETIPNRYADSDLPEGWVVSRPGQISFPGVCCVCMAPATTTYRSLLKINQASDIPVPLCGPCSRLVRRRWWHVMLAVAGAAIAAVALLALAIPAPDTERRWVLFILVALFVVPFAAGLLPRFICRPYNCRSVDADRGVFRFRGANPAFTNLLIEQVRQSNGEVRR